MLPEPIKIESKDERIYANKIDQNQSYAWENGFQEKLEHMEEGFDRYHGRLIGNEQANLTMYLPQELLVVLLTLLALWFKRCYLDLYFLLSMRTLINGDGEWSKTSNKTSTLSSINTDEH